MTFLEKIRQLSRAPDVQLNRFISEYKVTRGVVWLLIEGRDDLPYYDRLRDLFPPACEVRLWPCGNRDYVLRHHLEARIRYGASSGCLAFIDRDLEYLWSSIAFGDESLYVTESYSVENEVCHTSSIVRHVELQFGLSGNEDLLQHVAASWEQCLKAFAHLMWPVMVWIVAARIEGLRPNLSDISLGDYCVVEAQCDGVEVRRNPREQDVFGWLTRSAGCGSVPTPSAIFAAALSLNALGYSQDVVRGKFVAWMAVKFVGQIADAIRQNAKGFRPRVVISANNVTAMLSAYAEAASVRAFVRRHVAHLQGAVDIAGAAGQA